MSFKDFQGGTRGAKAFWDDTIAPLAAPAFGTITGHVFFDKNGNGIEDADDPGFANRLVFVDVNKNGIRDVGERGAKTDADGNYSIGHVAQGEYYVVLQEKGAFHVSAPSTQVTTYSWDNLSYNFVEISKTGNPLVLTNQDDGFAFFEANQPISFHGDQYDIYVSSNGFISFGSSDGLTSFINPALPIFNGPSNIVAPLWDDFTFTSGGGVYALDTGENIIIEWKNAQHFGDASGQLSTFEAIIGYDGTIVFQYKTIADSVTGTIGTQIGHGIESTQIGDTAANPANHTAYILTPSNVFVNGPAIVDVNAGATTANVDFGLSKVILPAPIRVDAFAADLIQAQHPFATHDLHVALV